MTGRFDRAVALVREFHRDKGLPIADNQLMPSSRSQLRALGNRVVEEAFELRQALQLGDLAEVIKELADVVYSSLGVVVALDLELDDVSDAASQSIPAEMVGDGPLAEPIGEARATAAARGLPVPESVSITPIALRLSEEVVARAVALRSRLEWRDTRRVKRELARLLAYCLDLMVVTAVPLDEAFLDIHRNNMTKQRAQRRGGVVQKPGKGPGFEKVDLSRLVHDIRPAGGDEEQ